MVMSYKKFNRTLIINFMDFLDYRGGEQTEK
jgi:hypothetical protein